MTKYAEAINKVPWRSFGPETTASKVGMSLVPVGTLPFSPPVVDLEHEVQVIDSRDGGFENFLMDIIGTAIQVDKHKLVSCKHVMEAFEDETSPPYLLPRSFMDDGTPIYGISKVQKALRYVDARHDKVNHNIDISVFLTAGRQVGDAPAEAPSAQWGDSTQVGVGDTIMIGGYPLGTSLFKTLETNRGIIQPTFYSGIVSAILPATNAFETRLFQLSMPSLGGLSGGAMFDPQTGKILGMVTCGLNTQEGSSLPMTYAIPSEIIQPFIEAINLKIDE